jgi:hypothetical protein
MTRRIVLRRKGARRGLGGKGPQPGGRPNSSLIGLPAFNTVSPIWDLLLGRISVHRRDIKSSIGASPSGQNQNEVENYHGQTDFKKDIIASFCFMLISALWFVDYLPPNP